MQLRLPGLIVAGGSCDAAVLVERFEAEANLLLDFVHLDDLEMHLLAWRERSGIRFAARPAWNLGKMAEAFNSFGHFDEGAKSFNPRHAAGSFEFLARTTK